MKESLKAFKLHNKQYYFKNEIFQMFYEGLGFVVFLVSFCSFMYILMV